MQASKYWSECLSILRDNLTESAFKTWFAPIEACSYENDVLVLQMPSQFCVEYIEENYIDILSKVLVRVFGKGTKLEYRVVIDSTSGQGTVIPSDTLGYALQPDNQQQTYNQPDTASNLSDVDSQLNPHLNFNEFVAGTSNQLARTAGISIAETPGKTIFNPFFVYGGSGVGKTHLANAIGNRIRQLYPQKRVLYVPANTFQMQYQAAVADNRHNDFFAFYQSMDVLIVDDIQYFADKKGTQNIFFFIFNHLHQMGKQIILTSDKSPVELRGLEQRLLSRFKWGLAAEITSPDFQLRKDILLNKIYRDGLDIPEEVVDYIADNVRQNVRDLEGVLASMMAHSTFVQTPIDMNLARQAVSRVVDVVNNEITIDSIIENVCAYYNVSVKEVPSRTKRREVANVRQVSMYLARKLTEQSLGEIGRAVNRDHATVVHSIKVVEQQLEYDPMLRRAVKDIENELRK